MLSNASFLDYELKLKIAVVAPGHIIGEEEILSGNPTRIQTITCISRLGEVYYMKKKHLFKHFSIDPAARLKIETLMRKKKWVHKKLYSQITETTNENKYLMTDINKVSSMKKVTKTLSEMKKNPVATKRPSMLSSTHQRSSMMDLSPSKKNTVFSFSLPKTSKTTQSEAPTGKDNYVSLPSISSNPFNSTTHIKNPEYFNLDEKSQESFSQMASLQNFSLPTHESDALKDPAAHFEESRLAKLIEEDFLKEVKLKESTNRITSFGYNIDQKIAQLYPTFQKYPNGNIHFLQKYLKNLQDVHKNEESEQVINVKEKLGRVQTKSIKEYIQIMRKLFNFYAIKKIDKIDISKENIKEKFSQRTFSKTQEMGSDFDELYNFKLPKESQLLLELKYRKEKIIDIDDLNVDDPPPRKKDNNFDWLRIKRQKKNHHVIRVENDNSIILSKNLYCE